MPSAKRPSARKSDSYGPRPPEIFVDRSLGRRKVLTRLRALYPAVIAHDERFLPDAEDRTWLREAGRKRWIVLTRDDRIRYRPGEHQVIIQARVRCFCLNPTKGMTGDDMADVLAGALPRILKIAQDDPQGGYIKGVNRRGQVRHLFP